MLELARVTKTYGGKTILASVDIRLEKGAVICLAGPSGIGKSTIIDIAAGLVKPDSGSVRRNSDRLGYAFQNPALLPWKSALENLEFVLSGQRKEWEALAMDWLDRMGLKQAASRKPRELSGGMRKRLGFAMSVVAAPELLFLDEPFAFLDDGWRKVVAEELKKRNARSGLTVLMASHELEPARRAGAEILFAAESPVRIRFDDRRSVRL